MKEGHVTPLLLLFGLGFVLEFFGILFYCGFLGVFWFFFVFWWEFFGGFSLIAIFCLV